MKKNKFIENIKKTWPYVKSEKKSLIAYALVSIVEGIIGVVIPIYASKVILNITNSLMEQLLYSAIIVFCLNLIIYSVYILKGHLYQKMYLTTLNNLQIAVARETLKLEISEIDKTSSGVFIDRLNKDTDEIAGTFAEYTYWISKVISNIGIVGAIFILNKYLFIHTIIVATTVFFVNKKRLSKQYSIQKNLKKLNEKKTGLTSELVRGIRDIKIMNANKNILNQVTDKIKASTNEAANMMEVRRTFLYYEYLTDAVADFSFLILGMILFSNSLLSIPSFVIIYNYQEKVKYLLTGVVEILEFNKKFIVSSERIYEVIENDKFKKEKFGSKEVKKLNGNIRFIDVDFEYNETKQILNKINFVITPNEQVAFVGKSGEGKTTIFNLITRLYRVNKGQILLDDYDINELSCSSIRDNMSIITQSPYIFNFTIKENLLLAKDDASMEEIREACKLACIDDYIMSLPDKYDTMVGENGVILSGGQKQRLAIARALLMKTEIILFDEATSALDNGTQSEIKDAINNLKGEYTILIVAHRLSTIIDCDKIFVVNEGKIVASGTHKELLKTSEFYKSLYNVDIEK